MRKVFKLLETAINNGDINEINEAFKKLVEKGCKSRTHTTIYFKKPLPFTIADCEVIGVGFDEDVAKPLIINEDDDQELLGGFALEYVLDENKFKIFWWMLFYILYSFSC